MDKKNLEDLRNYYCRKKCVLKDREVYFYNDDIWASCTSLCASCPLSGFIDLLPCELDNKTVSTKTNKKQCRDCAACHFVKYSYEKEGRYVCWGVSEPFEIKDINEYCTEY